MRANERNTSKTTPFTKSIGTALVLLALGATILLLGTATASAQNVRDFWVLNNTGATIVELYVSPHERTDWGNDTLHEVIPDGRGSLITFPDRFHGSCTMDFRLVFDDGSEQTYLQGRNTCTLGAVSFNESTSSALFWR